MISRWGVIGIGLSAAVLLAQGAQAADTRSVAGLSRSLQIAESRSGAASPHLLPLLDRLAGAQFDTGALSEAAELRRRALKIALRAYGAESANTANAMIAFADVEILRRHYAHAEPLLSAAVPVLAARLGANAPVLAAPLAALARIAVARGDLPAAEGFANRANGIAARRQYAASTEPLRALGAVYAAQERFDDGERVLRQAIARDRQRSGGNSPELARSLAQLANLKLRAKRYDEALPLIEQAVAIDQERLGAAHPLIADDFADLGLIYEGLGRDEDASQALTFAVDLLTREGSEESTRLGYAELELSTVLRRLGQTPEADDAFKDAQRIIDDTNGDERKRERQI